MDDHGGCWSSASADADADAENTGVQTLQKKHRKQKKPQIWKKKKNLGDKSWKKIATAIETCLVSEKMTDRSFLEMIPFNAIICYEIY